MQFRLPDGVLRVTGERLVCHAYLAGAVGVEGRIDGIFLGDACDCPSTGTKPSRREEEPC